MNIRSLEKIALPIKVLTVPSGLPRLIAAQVIIGLDTDTHRAAVFHGHRVWADLAAGRGSEWDEGTVAVYRYGHRDRAPAMALLALLVDMAKGTVSYRELE